MRYLSSCLTVLALLSAAAAAEQVDNPQYQMWSAFKAGSLCAHHMEAQHEGQTMQMKLTVTLKEIDDEKAVISTQASMSVQGQEMQMPAQEQTIPAKVEADAVDPEFNVINDPNAEKGEETIEVDGQKLACTWYKVNSEQNGQQVTGKVWLCDKVPGGMVRYHAESNGDQMKVDLQKFTTK